MITHAVRDLAAARRFAERIEATLSVPYEVGAGAIRIGASIGTAISNDSATVSSLLAQADLAMYENKTAHRATTAKPAHATG